MVNIFRSSRLNTLCLCGTLVTFSINTIPNLQALTIPQADVGLNDVALC
jgi:hypothetical protein